MLSKQFLVFLKVAEVGSFTKAAALLFVTPASVMKLINSFEGHLGFEVFRRSNRGLELTEAGRSLYESGKRLKAEADEAVLKAKSIHFGEGAVIRVGTSLLNPSKVLTDLLNPISPKTGDFKFRIVPYEDDREQILSVTSSLEEGVDIIVGCLNSKRMQETADYLPLGFYELCIAVPQGHRLASRNVVSFDDLHGERLVKVSRGDTDLLDAFHEMLAREHPQIQIEEVGYFYDADTFNYCEENNYLLLTLSAWRDIHPSLTTIPFKEPWKIPYGILYSKNPSLEVKDFINAVKAGLDS